MCSQLVETEKMYGVGSISPIRQPCSQCAKSAEANKLVSQQLKTIELICWGILVLATTLYILTFDKKGEKDG
jgi:hypothetical protein